MSAWAHVLHHTIDQYNKCSSFFKNILFSFFFIKRIKGFLFDICRPAMQYSQLERGMIFLTSNVSWNIWWFAEAFGNLVN